MRKRRPLLVLPAGEAITHLAALGDCWGDLIVNPALSVDLVSDLIAPASLAKPAAALSGRSILDDV